MFHLDLSLWVLSATGCPHPSPSHRGQLGSHKRGNLNWVPAFCVHPDKNASVPRQRLKATNIYWATTMWGTLFWSLGVQQWIRWTQFLLLWSLYWLGGKDRQKIIRIWIRQFQSVKWLNEMGGCYHRPGDEGSLSDSVLFEVRKMRSNNI